MILYLDTSALIKLVVDEDGSRDALDLWESADRFHASWLAYAEAVAALGAAVRARRITRAGLRSAGVELDRYWAELDPIQAGADVCRSAGGIAVRHRLRGPDAVHLASALLVGGDDLVVATWDRELARAASDAGLRVAPAAR